MLALIFSFALLGSVIGAYYLNNLVSFSKRKGCVYCGWKGSRLDHGSSGKQRVSYNVVVRFQGYVISQVTNPDRKVVGFVVLSCMICACLTVWLRLAWFHICVPHRNYFLQWQVKWVQGHQHRRYVSPFYVHSLQLLHSRWTASTVIMLG